MPFVQRGHENTAGNQSLLLLREIVRTTRHDSCYWLVAVADNYLLSISHELDVRTKLSFEITDVYPLHVVIIIAHMTILVMLGLF